MALPAAEVTLRPFREEEVAVIEDFLADPTQTGEFQWFGWRDTSPFRRRWTQNRLLDDESGMLLVIAAGQVSGFVSWRRFEVGYGSWHWRIGIALLPPARGRGVGTRSQQLLADYLFRISPAHRIEAGTDVENIAEQRALEKAGFRREGILRGLIFRDGAWRDEMLYSRLRSDTDDASD